MALISLKDLRSVIGKGTMLQENRWRVGISGFGEIIKFKEKLPSPKVAHRHEDHIF